MDEQFIDILAKNFLTKVKENIRKNMITLEGKQEETTDKKILEVIKSIINSKKENNDIELNNEIINALMLHYTAIYNNNMELLNTLQNNNFDWRCTYNHMTTMKLFVLDKRITNNFEINEYLKILKKDLKTIYNFYTSLYNQKNNNKINKDEIIKKFCNIIKMQHNSMNQKKQEEETNYLNITTLTNFTEEEILNLTETQKEILKNEGARDIDIKINLIKKYNFSKRMIYYSQFKKYFTEEEISNLTDSDIKQYENIFGYRSSHYKNNEYLEKNAIDKLKQIKIEYPNFNYELDAMAYDVLTIKQIISLSEKGVEKINYYCNNYRLIKHTDPNFFVTETSLRHLIKNTYNKDKMKNNIKKLVKKN